jgi:hypothetical protein
MLARLENLGRVATRYDKLAKNDRAGVAIAAAITARTYLKPGARPLVVASRRSAAG